MSAEILVSGASGNLGKCLTTILDREGLHYHITTRKKVQSGEKVLYLDLQTGEGIDNGCVGKKIIFHLASGTKKADRSTDVLSVQKLIGASLKNKVSHFIFISIVGIEKVPIKYYKFKVEAENIIKSSGVPYTILRATQFHEFIDNMISTFLKYKIGPLQMNGKNQPIETSVVAEKMFDIYKNGPINNTLEIGGPQVLDFRHLSTSWQKYTHKKKMIIPIPTVGKALSAIRTGALTCSVMNHDSCSWEDYLKQKYN